MKRTLLLFLLLALAGTSMATIHSVTVNALSFSPANLTVQQGDTVRWVKTGGFHNVAEISNPAVFRSGDPTSSPFTYDFVFAAPLTGTYNYECEVHAASGMVGTVTVQGGGSAPDAPTNISPADNTRELPSNVTLAWNPADGADEYVVMLSTGLPFPHVVFMPPTTETTIALTNLEPGLEWTWNVKATNEFGETTGESWHFVTALGEVTGPTPSDGQVNVPLAASLVWHHPVFATSYNVYFGTTEPLALLGTTSDSMMTLPELNLNTTYLWRVMAINQNDSSTSATWSFSTIETVDADDAVLPVSFKVGSAYPNPFNNNVRIALSVANGNTIDARIFDISGREVATLVSGRLNAGEHNLEWNAAGNAAGLYFLQVRGAQATQTQKLIYLP
ncbi:MAG: T9SS type A sorting domain-containing protein [Calditrichaeota bacterium]|nr:T9SS type A sorting domain-containing protein [Calditrichota bacterium]MCB9391766.1 T9SS type A sorting domain-containing protein [Calditrichota bacterium]